MMQDSNSGPRFTVTPQNEAARLVFDSADSVTLHIDSNQPGQESNAVIVLKERLFAKEPAGPVAYGWRDGDGNVHDCSAGLVRGALTRETITIESRDAHLLLEALNLLVGDSPEPAGAYRLMEAVNNAQRDS